MGTSDQPDTVLQPDEIRSAVGLTDRVLEQLDRILLGRPALHRMVVAGILSRGHILLEGVPGVGKTALVKALGQLMNLGFNRVQFTPDLMPGDILGTHILQERGDGGREMTFQPGPVFTNILLADEINRASPKTQSALLEAMQERSVTLLGTTRMLPEPFFVLASQNPIELEGTYPLPEAQLDRFLFKLVVTDVPVDVLDNIISTRRRGEPPTPTWTMTAEELNRVFAVMDRVFLPKPVSRYISRLVAATHGTSAEATDDVRAYVAYGASPRAAIAMAEAARAHALLAARPAVGFGDVKVVAPAVLNHRIVLNYKARFDRVDAFRVVDGLLAEIDEAGLNLPKEFEIAEVSDA
ncbi:MAG: AAA family ATPase [Verrucomicrobia bacterium]|nr:AAA family ATPase [Verrucomicrobiota bacterium]